MSKEPKTADVKEIAGELLKLLNQCQIASYDRNGNLVLDIYKHPDFYTAAMGRKIDYETLNDEQKEKLDDECDLIYGPDKLREDLSLGSLKKVKQEKIQPQMVYMRAKLEGIVGGHIKTGDGNLGDMLLEFCSQLSIVAEEEVSRSFSNRDNPQNAMPEALAKLYKKHFDDMLKKVYEGAEKGLFTSGCPIVEPMRGQSMAEKYASGKGDGAKKL